MIFRNKILWLFPLWLMLAGCNMPKTSAKNDLSELLPAPLGTPRRVTISWNANHETAVNTTGGGYKVFYGTTSGFTVPGTSYTTIDVPYVSGSSSPNSVTVTLGSGYTYYVRVAAYSTLKTLSGVSSQISVVVQ